MTLTSEHANRNSDQILDTNLDGNIKRLFIHIPEFTSDASSIAAPALLQPRHICFSAGTTAASRSLNVFRLTSFFHRDLDRGGEKGKSSDQALRLLADQVHHGSLFQDSLILSHARWTFVGHGQLQGSLILSMAARGTLLLNRKV
ncbi:hypothetical protein F2Q70_00002123 [Brassica cretica]|uniref:Uncharacterized protein n=1 Tax=Brassica cretica TaxID=69181 RepID=A0A8S9IK75_BRACR|nr:hypothetical protein F2Q70_00002123 [Brassica cretica]